MVLVKSGDHTQMQPNIVGFTLQKVMLALSLFF